MTDGVDQAFATVYIDVTTAAYEIYLNAVADVDQAYAGALNAAGDNRLAAITAARESALSSAEQEYIVYESTAETARVTFETNVVSSYSDYQTAGDVSWAAWDSAFMQASDTYDTAIASAQADFDSAEANAYQVYLSALNAAETAYSFHVDPFQADRDSALALFQADPENQELEQAYLDAEAALIAAVAEATAIKDSTIANAETDYETAQDANSTALASAEDASWEAFDVAHTAATDARLSAEAAATLTYDTAIEAAQNSYEATEAGEWDSYLSSLTTLETSLASTEAGIQGQFASALADALAAWQQSEQTAWDGYLTALSVSPIPQPQARITDPITVTPAPVEPFQGFVADARKVPDLAVGALLQKAYYNARVKAIGEQAQKKVVNLGVTNAVMDAIRLDPKASGKFTRTEGVYGFAQVVGMGKTLDYWEKKAINLGENVLNWDKGTVNVTTQIECIYYVQPVAAGDVLRSGKCVVDYVFRITIDGTKGGVAQTSPGGVVCGGSMWIEHDDLKSMNLGDP